MNDGLLAMRSLNVSPEQKEKEDAVMRRHNRLYTAIAVIQNTDPSMSTELREAAEKVLLGYLNERDEG